MPLKDLLLTIYILIYLTSHHKFIAAISVRESDARAILHEPHVQAVLSCSFIVRLVKGPSQVGRERKAISS
jgi:hypothetical protein